MTSSPAPSSKARSSQAASAAYGADAAEMFGDGAVRSLGRQLIADPDLLDRRVDRCGFRSAARSTSPPSRTATRPSEQLVDQLESKDALRRTHQHATS